jgi:hypothetical protein
MTTPAQAQPAHAAAVDPLVQWFDAELRPVLLEHLAAADGQAAARAAMRHRQTIAAIEHWLTSFGQRSATWTPQTREAVTVLASEVRGILDGIGAF